MHNDTDNTTTNLEAFQQEINWLKSEAIAQIASWPKSQWLAEDGAIDAGDVERYARSASDDILARAIKARDRRDRDGKKRRPVTDGLIEHAQGLYSRAISAEAEVVSLRLEAEVLRDVIKKQSEAMEAMEAEISELKAKIAGIAQSIG